MYKPLISVILPAYRVEKTIKETLDSVLAQTYTKFEAIIVVDGDFPSLTANIAEEYAVLDSRFRVVYQENRGLAGARNTGIRESKGELVAFLDTDDLYHPQKLQQHVNHFTDRFFYPDNRFQTSSNLGVSFSRSEFIDGDSNKLGIYQMPKLIDITSADIITGNPVGNGSAPVLSRQLLDDIAYHDIDRDYLCWFDEDFKRAEDLELWLRISLTTKWKIEGIGEALTYYRINDTGLSADIDKQREAMDMVLDKTATYVPEFINEYRSLANSYQYRYLARRAVRNQDAATAIKFMNKAFLTDYRILTTSPKRTLLTAAASYLLLIPRPIYSFVENKALGIMGKEQKRTINKGE